MKLLKLFLPKEKMQEVEEIESWTVNWYLFIDYKHSETKNKVFISNSDADKFVVQLYAQAEFLGCGIKVKLIKN